jgi:hypothetical protein
MRNFRKLGALALGASLAMQYSALASPVVITINDQLPGPLPKTPANENNETEPGTAQEQVWDLEAMVFDNATKNLTIVGGYNFSTGASAGGRTYHPGDIYIDVDAGLLGLPGQNSDGGYTLRDEDYGYDFVIHFKNRSNVPVGAAVGTTSTHVNFGDLSDFEYEIFDLRAGTSKNWDVFFDSTGESNPFIYDSGGTSIGTTGSPALFSSYASDAALNGAFGGVLGWTPTTATGWAGDERHYSLSVELDDITSILGVSLDEAKFTMGCGNDMIRGDFKTGGGGVPDGGSTLMLLGGGISLLSLARWRMRKA